MRKILLADDHAILRGGLRRILEAELGDVTIGEAGNIDEVFANIRSSNWDLLILDISLPGRSGLDALPEIKALRPALPP